MAANNEVDALKEEKHFWDDGSRTRYDEPSKPSARQGSVQLWLEPILPPKLNIDLEFNGNVLSQAVAYVEVYHSVSKCNFFMYALDKITRNISHNVREAVR